MTRATEPAESAAAPQIPLLLSTVFLAYLGQMTLNPIIAPLAREVGLAEWQIGATISTAAVMVVVSSQFWGRRSQSWGRKPVLVAALGLGAVAMAGFAAVAAVGMRAALTGTAGPTLLVDRDEQGGLTGLIGATNGLTFVLAPTASTALYGLWPPLPAIVGAAIMALVALFVLLHPRFRGSREPSHVRRGIPAPHG